MNAIIYGDDIGSAILIPGERLSYFYLHGQAETKNGYDCCNGNIEAFSYVIRGVMFLATLVYQDGKKDVCLVVPYPYQGAIQGRVVLIDDLPALDDAMKHRNNNISMYEHHKEQMKKDYPETWKHLKKNA